MLSTTGSGRPPRWEQPVYQAGYGLPCALADQRADHDVARVMHSGVYPGVCYRRRHEPQRHSEPGLVPADGRGEGEPRRRVTGRE
jgi:hypothetical protein